MDWFYDLAQPFIRHPERVIGVALVWFVTALALRKVVRRPLFILAGAWGIFAFLEEEAWRTRADIRVDLLLTWPVLCAVTIGCLAVAVKQIVKHRRAFN